MGAEVDAGMDTGKMLELHLKGLSYAQIGRVAGGLAKQTICQRLSKFTKLMADPQAVKAFREHEAELLDAVRSSLITTLADDLAVKKGRQKLSGYQKVGMYGILFDKMRLLRNESTANVSNLTAIIQAALGPVGEQRREPVIQAEDTTTPSVSELFEADSADSVPDNEAGPLPSRRKIR